MYTRKLNEDIERFLGSYFRFEIVQSPQKGYVALGGQIAVLDGKDRFWGSFDVLILVNETEYPYTIPVVIEQSMVIDRDWNLHISKDGECCLDIPHKLQKLKRQGIVLEDFYQNVIYPFFANYHFKNATGDYANGEYRHDFGGIVQYYHEAFQLADFDHIIALLETALNGNKYEPNRTCRFCGGSKYKKCCRKIVYKLKSIEKSQLRLDLQLFKQYLPKGVLS